MDLRFVWASPAAGVVQLYREGEQCLGYTFWERPALAAHGRSVSGSVLNTPGGMALIDCGEGMQKRIIDPSCSQIQWFAAPYSSIENTRRIPDAWAP